MYKIWYVQMAGTARVRKVKAGTLLERLPGELYEELGKRLHSCDYTIEKHKSRDIYSRVGVIIRSGGMAFEIRLILKYVDRDAMARFAYGIQAGVSTPRVDAQSYHFLYEEDRDVVRVGIGATPAMTNYMLDLIVCDELIDMFHWLATA